MQVFIHPSADVSPQAEIGDGTYIWHQVQVREGARVGRNCILSKGVYVDLGVRIGECVKIQNYASIYHGSEIRDGVFVGPYVCLTNDKLPRAVNPDGTLKTADDWAVGHTVVNRGASLGAHATILPGVVIGEWAMVGGGAVVAKDVPAHGLVIGNPARLIGFVCACGGRLEVSDTQGDALVGRCTRCGEFVPVPLKAWEEAQ